MPEPTPICRRVRACAPTVSAGVMTADLGCLRDAIAALERAGAALVHFDVMDGSFCPMMTLGPPTIRAAKTALLKDVHLMIRDPLPKLPWFVDAGADLVTVPVEGSPHLHRVLQALGEMKNANDPLRGILRGVSLNPGTPLAALEPVLAEVDHVLLLAVNPGWGGQKFIGSTPRRLAELRALLRTAGREDVLVTVDGGVTRSNVAEIARLGADILVAGSAVFDGKSDPEANARFLLAAVGEAARAPAGGTRAGAQNGVSS
jgi:ribulose-phosphate 3-epimerase